MLRLNCWTKEFCWDSTQHKWYQIMKLLQKGMQWLFWCSLPSRPRSPDNSGSTPTTRLTVSNTKLADLSKLEFHVCGCLCLRNFWPEEWKPQHHGLKTMPSRQVLRCSHRLGIQHVRSSVHWAEIPPFQTSYGASGKTSKAKHHSEPLPTFSCLVSQAGLFPFLLWRNKK